MGDYIENVYAHSLLWKAICDNLTHATVGFFSAIVIILKTDHRIVGMERIGLVVLSVLVSSLIDIDHFVAAKSLKLSVLIFIRSIVKHVIVNGN